MKNKFFLLLISVTFSSHVLFSQANLLNARVPQDVGQLNEKQIASNDEEPLAYGFVDDRDILWSKTVWERIDLDERVNFPYYYPTDTLKLGSERRSLFDVLVKNLKNRNMKEVYRDDYFKEKYTYQDVLTRLRGIVISEGGTNQLNEQGVALTIPYDIKEIEGFIAQGILDDQFVDQPKITAAEIEEYWIKGTWYFNKRLGELKYRLLAITPVAKEVGQDDGELIPLCWIWYPDARKVLNDAKVFNTRNSSKPISYDNMLNSRRFSAMIYKEENVYEDREVKNYIKEDALKQLLESERIKNVILDYELDMWNN